MLKKASIVAAGLVVALIATGVAYAEVAPPRGAWFQTEDPAEISAPVLSPGERFTNAGWDLEIGGWFRRTSPLRPGYDEVRLSVGFRHRLGVVPFTAAAFTGEYGYPRLQIRDAAGEIHGIAVRQAGQTMVANSVLVSQPSDIPASWTVGFQIPTEAVEPMIVQAVLDDQIVAQWDLSQPQGTLNVWGPPAGVDVLSAGETFLWSQVTKIDPGQETVMDALSITPLSFDYNVCGDPGREHASSVLSMSVEVVNDATVDDYWPGVLHPAMAAVAVWEDGSSARFRSDAQIATETELLQRSPEQVIVAPGGANVRIMDFATPRDARFQNAQDAPRYVVFYRPAGEPVWVEIAGAPASGLSGVADVCSGPFGFESSAPFTIDATGAVEAAAAEEEVEEANVADAAAQTDLRDALVAARSHLADFGSYEATPADLELVNDNLSYVDDVTAAGRGLIGYTASGDRIVMVTESASGTWFCIADPGDGSTTYGQGASRSDADSIEECSASSW